MKEFLSQNGVKFAYMNITDSMHNLKMFLKLRDTRPEFDEIRAANRVGLPCIYVKDGEGEKVYLTQPELSDLLDPEVEE